MKLSKNRVLWVSLALAWIFDLLFWKREPGISFFVMVILVMFSGYALGRSLGMKPASSVWILVFVDGFFAVMSIFRTETFTQVVNVGLSVVTLALIAATFLGGKWIQYSFGDYIVNAIRLFLSAISRVLIGVAKKSEDENKESREEPVEKPKSKVGWSILRGVILALPIVLVLSALLASADPVFSKAFSAFLEIFKIEKLTEYLFRLFYILILTYLLAGVFLHAYSQSKDEKLIGVDKPWLAPFLGWIEAVIILGAVDLLFVTFVAIQFKYFFGGSSNIHIEGYTFSEYAVKGFTELVVVAVISLLLLQIVSTITKRLDKKHTITFSALSVGLVGLLIVILVSAFYRLNLYETAYGFSQLRLYAHVFMIWLGILLLATAVIEAVRKQRAFALAVLICGIGFSITLNLVNVDQFIARQNIARARAGYPLDTDYLISLSDDSVPVLAKQYTSQLNSVEIRDHIGAALSCKLAEHQLYTQTKANKTVSEYWGSYNWSRSQAAEIITRMQAELTSKYPVKQDAERYSGYVQLGNEQVYCQYYDPMMD